jgi:hypothetical protein
LLEHFWREHKVFVGALIFLMLCLGIMAFASWASY